MVVGIGVGRSSLVGLVAVWVGMGQATITLSATSALSPVGHLDPQDRVPGEVLLAGTATRPLARNNRTTLEDLATPHAPRLGALNRTGQALDLQRARPAEGLRNLEVSRGVGEPQVRVVLAARQLRVQPEH